MSAYQVTVTIAEDGKLVLDDLPFLAGDLVQVIIIEPKATSDIDRYPLRGTVVKYLNPTDPLEP